MKYFHAYNLLLSCNPLNILGILAISLNQNMIFAKLLEKVFGNDVFLPSLMFVDSVKIIWILQDVFKTLSNI